jgi:hypothetical protein
MKILEKLKAIGIHIPKLKEITGIKFSSLISIDRSIHIQGSTVIIDPDGLAGKQKRALKKIIPELLDKSGAIVSASNTATVDEVLEALPSIHSASKNLASIIPLSDVPLLNACIYLRLKFDNGECVEALKTQIMRVYGTRGGNFANLCSAGYLETWFVPLYEELLRVYPDNPSMAKAMFLIHYKTILNESPWTEFVSAAASASKVTAHIADKMKRNLTNGVRYMNIHGLGERNVKKIEAVILEIEKQIGAVVVRMEKDPARIFARLEIPAQISN